MVRANKYRMRLQIKCPDTALILLHQAASWIVRGTARDSNTRRSTAAESLMQPDRSKCPCVLTPEILSTALYKVASLLIPNLHKSA